MQLSVTVVRADTGQAFDVDLPGDADVGALLPLLVDEMKLPREADGNIVAYELSNKRTGDSLREGKTLLDRGVKIGDVLMLTSSFVAG